MPCVTLQTQRDPCQCTRTAESPEALVVLTWPVTETTMGVDWPKVPVIHASFLVSSSLFWFILWLGTAGPPRSLGCRVGSRTWYRMGIVRLNVVEGLGQPFEEGREIGVGDGIPVPGDASGRGVEPNEGLHATGRCSGGGGRV